MPAGLASRVPARSFAGPRRAHAGGASTGPAAARTWNRSSGGASRLAPAACTEETHRWVDRMLLPMVLETHWGTRVRPRRSWESPARRCGTSWRDLGSPSIAPWTSVTATKRERHRFRPGPGGLRVTHGQFRAKLASRRPSQGKVWCHVAVPAGRSGTRADPYQAVFGSKRDEVHILMSQGLAVLLGLAAVWA